MCRYPGITCEEAMTMEAKDLAVVSGPAQLGDGQGMGEAKLLALFYRSKWQRSQSEHTLKAYQGDLARFFDHVGKPLADLTITDLLEWAQTLDDKSPATRARVISSVRSLFRFAQRTGFIRFNPAEILDRPKVPVTSGHKFLIRDELQALLREARNPRRSVHLYPALALLATTALRISELTGIRWQHLFRDMNGHIGLQVTEAKGGKPRVVKVLPHVWQILQACRRHQGLADDLDAQDAMPLFAGAGGRPIGVRNLQKSLAAAARAAGIRKRVSPHWLRHTAITMSLLGGARVEQAQVMAGHSDLRTTTRYAHTAQQLQETAADFIRLDV